MLAGMEEVGTGLLDRLDAMQRVAASRARRPAADRGRPGHRQDPDAHPPDRLPLRRAERLPRAVPGDHVHPAGRRGAAAPPRRRCSAPVAEDVTVGTFHALGLTILRENAEAAGLPAGLPDRRRRRAGRGPGGGRRRRRPRTPRCCASRTWSTWTSWSRLPVALLRDDPALVERVPGALAVDLRRRVPGRRRGRSTSCCGCSAPPTATSARSATRTRRSTRSGAPTSATSCASRRTSPTPGWSG